MAENKAESTNKPEFTMEFTNEVASISGEFEQKLYDEAEQRLTSLRGGHSDIVGAAVSLEQVAPQRNPDLYRARVVAFVRPENIAGVAEQENALLALKSALTAVERQVREKRERLRSH